MRPIFSCLALTAMLLTTGCLAARPATAVQTPAQPQAKQAAQAEIKQITVKEVAPLLKAHPNAQFIDVRMLDEYAAGHAPGALLRPLPELKAWAATLDKARPVVVMCQSGVRSMKAATQLQLLGFGDITNVQGGMGAWQKDGTLPVVVGPGRRTSPSAPAGI